MAKMATVKPQIASFRCSCRTSSNMAKMAVLPTRSCRTSNEDGKDASHLAQKEQISPDYAECVLNAIYLANALACNDVPVERCFTPRNSAELIDS